MESIFILLIGKTRCSHSHWELTSVERLLIQRSSQLSVVQFPVLVSGRSKYHVAVM